MVLLGQQILELEAYRKVPYDIEEMPSGTARRLHRLNASPRSRCCDGHLVTGLLKNARYLDEDSLHRRSLEQEPIHGLDDNEGTITSSLYDVGSDLNANPSFLLRTDNSEESLQKTEVVVKNPLVALKAISKDFKAVTASDEVHSLLPSLLIHRFSSSSSFLLRACRTISRPTCPSPRARTTPSPSPFNDPFPLHLFPPSPHTRTHVFIVQLDTPFYDFNSVIQPQSSRRCTSLIITPSWPRELGPRVEFAEKLVYAREIEDGGTGRAAPSRRRRRRNGER